MLSAYGANRSTSNMWHECSNSRNARLFRDLFEIKIVTGIEKIYLFFDIDGSLFSIMFRNSSRLR